MSDFPGDARAWADHHGELSRFASHLFHHVMGAFKALERQQYASPWNRRGLRHARWTARPGRVRRSAGPF